MSAIQLIVGLGNPGNEYRDTRHNAGFWWIDEICAQTGAKLHSESKFFGQVGKLPGKEVWLLKPDTFMNASGRAVAALAKFYKIAPQSILVVHDELDLPVGSAKFKQGGGHGGHNGLRDIIAQLGADFWRLRIGIGHPGKSSEGKREQVVNFVLHAPSRQEMQAISLSIDDSSRLLDSLLQGEFEQAMLKLHSKSNT